MPTSLLHLPRELRYEIYALLCTNEHKSYPFNLSPITAIDTRPPPTNLQLTCRFLHEESQEYFYGKATFRLLVNCGMDLLHRGPNLAALAALRRAKKVEMYLHWTFKRFREGDQWPDFFRGWLDERIGWLLEEAMGLEMLVVSVSDVSRGVEWRVQKGMMTPLERMRGRVEFRLGQVLAKDGEEEVLRERVGRYIGELDRDTVFGPSPR